MLSFSRQDGLFDVTNSERYQTVDDLFEKSQPTPIYYALLVLSSIIIASGLLLSQPAIVIGGMLITPVLSPLLLTALGFSLGELHSIRQAISVMFISVTVVVGVSLVAGFIFGTNGHGFALEDSLRNAVLYFVVATASGIAATFGWVRRDVSSVLPGIAIAVSLVPPLSLIGISLSVLDFDGVRTNLFLTIFNIIGILIGSTVTFSFLRFDRTRKVVEENAEAVEEKKGKNNK